MTTDLDALIAEARMQRIEELAAELRQERERAKPQAEPTDAEVEAAMGAYWQPLEKGFDIGDMRAALRAAAAVREGER